MSLPCAFLSAQGAAIERRAGLSSDEFLDRYYAANRPVILTGEMSGWPALAKWTPEYLKHAVGSKTIREICRPASHSSMVVKPLAVLAN